MKTYNYELNKKLNYNMTKNMRAKAV